MAKLHIYRKVGKAWTHIADGDGEIAKVGSFTVTLTSHAAAVSSGNTYEVRQGQQATGTLCNCVSVVGGVATFNVSGSGALAGSTLEDVRDFYAALDAVSKTVQIQIAAADLEELKTNNYALCFAKKVGSGGDPGSYNVVWQSLTDYLHSTTFSWTPQFALFGTNTFDENVTVTAETNTVVIGLGEMSLLDATGELGAASTGGSDTAVTMVNQYGPIHPGLSQLSVLNGISQVTPLYVAQHAIVQGQDELTPIEKVLVWFQQDIETSTMFSTARSLSVEIDLTQTNKAARLYQKGAWVTP